LQAIFGEIHPRYHRSPRLSELQQTTKTKTKDRQMMQMQKQAVRQKAEGAKPMDVCLTRWRLPLFTRGRQNKIGDPRSRWVSEANFFLNRYFFCGVFELPSARNAQKRGKTKIAAKNCAYMDR
jgi:hypothetical protein